MNRYSLSCRSTTPTCWSQAQVMGRQCQRGAVWVQMGGFKWPCSWPITGCTRSLYSRMSLLPPGVYKLPHSWATRLGTGNEIVTICKHFFISLVPRLFGTRNVHAWRACYIFSRDHYVIKIGPEFFEQRGNVLRIIQPALHSTLGVYDIRTPIATYV